MQYFSNDEIKFPQHVISEISTAVTKGIKDQIGKYVVVPDDKISHVLNQIYSKSKSYNLYLADLNSQGTIRDIVRETIEFIIRDVSTTLGVETYHANLSKWDGILSSDDKGLQAHPKIKIRNTYNTKMGFMRY